MNKMRILLMFASKLDIPAREGREALQGVTLEYFFYGENGEQVESKISADGTYGMRRGKSFVSDLNVINKVSYVPGIYDGTFEMSIGSDGKPVLKLVDVDFVGKSVITLAPAGKEK